MIHARQTHALAASKEQEYLEGWQRARAELANFRKRMQEQQKESAAQAKRAAVEPLLAIADNMSSMIAHVPSDLGTHAWVQGVAHIARQMEQLLADYDVRPIKALHEPFDPSRHEAIEEVAGSTHKSGTVVAIVQPGYELGSMVLRPARVKIAK